MRVEQSRADNIDILKVICAFLIVCIHVPFPGRVGEYFTALTRVAVPIFFMITGYFYSDTVARHKEKQQIKKIFYLVVEANLLFFIWNITLVVLRRDSIMSYMQSIFSGKNMLKFLLFNESPLAVHLWYLGANFLCACDCFIGGQVSVSKDSVRFNSGSAHCRFAIWKILVTYFPSGVSIHIG